MVLVQLTLWNSCITMISIMQKLQYMILKFILNINLRMPRLPRLFCPISLKWDMDIDKILFILSEVKHKQFDCCLWVNRKSIEKNKYFLQYYKNDFRQFCFNHEPEVKGMFLFTIYKVFFHRTMSMERRKGSNKVLYKETLAQRQRPIHFNVSNRKGFPFICM